ncbi:MAG: bifunctional 2-polyprenyl-6-hydroxyphenol methylase/3-demethylubiquinol 3-O-methyltransferase UbiG [Pseudomonadota bacterium]
MAAAEESITPGKPLDATINPDEVAFYTRLASTWWDETGPFWPLHKLNKLRVAYIVDFLCDRFERDAGSERPLDGLRIVDVGCGGGILSESMARLGASVTGIDVVEKNIAVASLHASQTGLSVDYRAVTARALADAGERFDVVLNMEVVEHVADLDVFMQDCAALTDDNGAMVVATINRTPRSWLFAIVGAEYILRWLPRGTHRWRDFRKPGEIEALLDEHGLATTARTGVFVNPLTRRFTLIGDLGVNYMLTAVRRKAG